jgi:transposase
MGRPSGYPRELPEQAVRLARSSDRPISAVARDSGAHHKTLRTWVRQDKADDGSRNDRLATVEREELAALWQEVRDLRRSNEILKAASVLFTRELG